MSPTAAPAAPLFVTGTSQGCLVAAISFDGNALGLEVRAKDLAGADYFIISIEYQEDRLGVTEAQIVAPAGSEKSCHPALSEAVFELALDSAVEVLEGFDYELLCASAGAHGQSEPLAQAA